ncbi:MBL fold metallo-hydrolase [Sphingomonas faeni]|uniref:MBL fold metallo-hydrolase n=1 Tax=Sphingomonas faeni TaxID=185950 RepID=UPI00334C9687
MPAKVSPADITDVPITHSHGDHVGGLSCADGELAFPNATIRMTRAEMGDHAEPVR